MLLCCNMAGEITLRTSVFMDACRKMKISGLSVVTVGGNMPLKVFIDPEAPEMLLWTSYMEGQSK
jgi:hypothetical protein